MKRILGMVVAGVLSGSIHAMEQVALLTSDNQTVMLDVNKVPLFGTIQSVVADTFPKTTDGKLDYSAQKDPIPLRNVSYDVLTQLVDDTDGMRDKGALQIPTYSDETLSHTMGLLNAANYLGTHPLLCAKYAKKIAGLLISDRSLEQLQQAPTKHPAFKPYALAYCAKQMIYPYMPQTWVDRSTIEHDGIASVECSPDSSAILTKSRSREGSTFLHEAKMANVATGKVQYEIRYKCDNNCVYLVPGALVEDPGSSYVCVCDEDEISIESAASGEVYKFASSHARFYPLIMYMIQRQMFSFNSVMAIMPRRDDTLEVADLVTDRLLHEIKCEGPIASGVLSSDGRAAVVKSEDGVVKIVMIETGTVFDIERENTVLGATASPDNSKVMIMLDDDTAEIVDMATHEVLHRFKGEFGGHEGFFSSDSSMVASVWDGVGKILDAETGRVLYETDNSGRRRGLVKFSPDSSKAMFCTYESSSSIIEIVSVATGTVLEIKHDTPLAGAFFSPDSNRVMLFFDKSKSAEIINVARGDVGLHEFAARNIRLSGWWFDSKSDTQFLPDGNRAVVMSKNTAKIIEKAASNFDQALLMQLMEWCRTNKRSVPQCGWVEDVVHSYTDQLTLKAATERAFYIVNRSKQPSQTMSAILQDGRPIDSEDDTPVESTGSQSAHLMEDTSDSRVRRLARQLRASSRDSKCTIS